MPGGDGRKPPVAGISSAAGFDLDALVAQLAEEVRRGRVAGSASSVRFEARAAAERLWRVSADRPIDRRPGVRGLALRPVKLVLRRLMRWYVDPARADQRALNDALLKLVDDLSSELDRQRQRLDELEPQRPSG